MVTNDGQETITAFQTGQANNAQNWGPNLLSVPVPPNYTQPVNVTATCTTPIRISFASGTARELRGQDTCRQNDLLANTNSVRAQVPYSPPAPAAAQAPYTAPRAAASPPPRPSRPVRPSYDDDDDDDLEQERNRAAMRQMDRMFQQQNSTIDNAWRRVEEMRAAEQARRAYSPPSYYYGGAGSGGGSTTTTPRSGRYCPPSRPGDQAGDIC